MRLRLQFAHYALDPNIEAHHREIANLASLMWRDLL
jgi:hypothetical protein